MKKLFKKFAITAISIFSFLFAFFISSSNNIKAANPSIYMLEYSYSDLSADPFKKVAALDTPANALLINVAVRGDSTFNIDHNAFYVDVENTNFINVDYTTNITGSGTPYTDITNRQIKIYFYFGSGESGLLSYMNKDNSFFISNLINVLNSIQSNAFTSETEDVAYTISNPTIYGFATLRTSGSSFSIPYENSFKSTSSLSNFESSQLLDLSLKVIRFDDVVYTEQDIENARQEGFTEGANSINQDAIRQEGYDTGFTDGAASVDPTADNQDAINKYLADNKIYTEEEYLQNGDNKYQVGFTDGAASVDITSNDEQIYTEAYQEGYDDGHVIGFEEGKNSIDLEAIKKEEYDRGYQNGYNVGFADGEYSVDITKDNDEAIDIWLTKNKYYTQLDFDMNFELGFGSGKEYIYTNIESDEVVKEYVNNYIVKNKYYTETEYITNYEKGKEYVYKNIESDPIIKEYYKTKLLNNLVIDLSQKEEVVKVVKNYDIDVSDTGDTKITIHYGQDNYELKTETIVEVVPGESNNDSNTVDYSSPKTITAMIFLAVCVTVIIMLLFWWISSLGSKKIDFTSSKYKNVLRKRRRTGGKKYAKKI